MTEITVKRNKYRANLSTIASSSDSNDKYLILLNSLGILAKDYLEHAKEDSKDTMQDILTLIDTELEAIKDYQDGSIEALLFYSDGKELIFPSLFSKMYNEFYLFELSLNIYSDTFEKEVVDKLLMAKDKKEALLSMFTVIKY